VAGEIGVDERVALGRPVAAAIGQEFEDGRHRLLVRSHRPPDARRQMNAIRHGYADAIMNFDLEWKIFDDAHGLIH